MSQDVRRQSRGHRSQTRQARSLCRWGRSPPWECRRRTDRQFYDSGSSAPIEPALSPTVDECRHSRTPRPPRSRHLAAHESDWDAIRSWTDDKYMRFDVQPIGRNIIPASSMFSVQISTITMTRFCYGVEVDLRNVDAEAGNVLVLTTLQGSTRHAAGTRDETELTVGGTFVADCSRVDYRFGAHPTISS